MENTTTKKFTPAPARVVEGYQPPKFRLAPTHVIRPLAGGGKVEVVIDDDGAVRVERTGPQGWVVTIAPNGEIQEAA